jgi:hypothetical protein
LYGGRISENHEYRKYSILLPDRSSRLSKANKNIPNSVWIASKIDIVDGDSIFIRNHEILDL